MAVQAVQAYEPPKKKKKGFLDALGPLASLAGGAATIASGGTLAPLAGSLAAAQGGLGLAQVLKKEKPVEEAPAQLQPQGATQRKVSTFESDPNSVLRTGLQSLAQLPEPLRMEAGPVILNAFLQQGGRGAGPTA